MAKIGKKIKAAWESFDKNVAYDLKEAIDLAKRTSYSKFDGSIELVFKLNLDVRKAEQQLRGAVLLPNGTGKNVRVLVVTNNPEKQKTSTAAGADQVVDGAALEQKIKEDDFDFDVMVADPAMMPILGKYGKKLGPKGLMPNPKTGTVTPTPEKAVEELKKGKANYRTDKAGIVHTQIGKVSMDTDKLVENAQTVISLIKKLKPSTVKGAYMQNIVVSPTMGPGIKVKIEK
ncbi:50S ribosomal protein L1 [Mycoplasmopsis californica HAZ160_1]|uniref:Large ribosomal subunit protein uL1 n=1 Tax=Mycoplasmopsis californica HAZ160_1 TaxID=1397850 RepID=A0AAT9F7F4_9BACT|nr:50S ribosomal protein L1 [Mycoplasmopsis californica]BAP00840.1 50S ribosomal protein L1 [Mycoplasmopsis californica HAZ160_1]BBG40696.1 50S ribosomal protein L1 [Mycoplasmopsis californica]BBG41290.1 50S ribosomal protein L1 [Mycoplasmopsis californica]BBG41883.1 50S ribosomal protein L1 [Mycoplasmopsis californica]BBG42476.1 50S ribosomal protein L1 [Mycoplasmopsis californica]